MAVAVAPPAALSPVAEAAEPASMSVASDVASQAAGAAAVGAAVSDADVAVQFHDVSAPSGQ